MGMYGCGHGCGHVGMDRDQCVSEHTDGNRAKMCIGDSD